MAGRTRFVAPIMAVPSDLLLGVGIAAPCQCWYRSDLRFVVGHFDWLDARDPRDDDVDHYLLGGIKLLGDP